MSFFETLKKDCFGMLSINVYEEIAKTAAKLNSEDLIVDCGTAGGATCCAALKGSEYVNCPIITFDKFFGGSRDRFGPKEENIDRVKSIISKYDSTNRAKVVDIVFKRDLKLDKHINKKISLLILDMDGQIDRDVMNFSEYIATDNFIVIDDYASKVRFSRKNLSGDIHIDSKQYLTFELCEYFKKIGLLKVLKIVDNTLFGQLNIQNLSKIEKSKLLDIYSKLIFHNGHLKETNLFNFFKIKIKRLKIRIRYNQSKIFSYLRFLKIIS